MGTGQPTQPGRSCQAQFHQRWPDLRDAHVRTLAWLLDAPDLMAADAPVWQGRIASLDPMSADLADWLHALQRNPAALHQHLLRQPTGRLGRYAEQLLGFYLQQHGQLVAANLQVRDSEGQRATLGEFDFLVRRASQGNILEHWEFATKFYLLEQAPGSTLAQDAFVGPNLADSLGRKMRKIMERQLALASHPAAVAVLPAPVQQARALVKGWLFYRDSAPQGLAAMGISPAHCHGAWGELDELEARWPAGLRYVLLPRLGWLAPARVPLAESLDAQGLRQAALVRLAQEDAPILVAACEVVEGEVVELSRAFIVPSGWRERAERQTQQMRHTLHRL